jgi:hypothetical protein
LVTVFISKNKQERKNNKIIRKQMGSHRNAEEEVHHNISANDEEDDDLDAYMANADILDYLPKSGDDVDDDVFKISGDEDRLPELPKFLNRNPNINLDSTMTTITTDHTSDANEQAFDEEELDIIREMEKQDKSAYNDAVNQENYENEEDEEYEDELIIAAPKQSEERRIPSSSSSRSKLNEENNNNRQKTATTTNRNAESQQSITSTGTSQSRLYQHELSKPKFSAGRKQISISEAKLYGLLDDKGEMIDLKSTQKVLSPTEKLKLKSYYNEMSSAKPENPEEALDPKEFSFQPMRSQQALQAMKNKKCGYDFMDRVNNRGNFIDRVNQLAGPGQGGSKDGKISKTEYERMKSDYDALLNKLQCSKCMKSQSFDEFINKKRMCTMCGVKFQKLNISSGLSFTRKNEEYEKKRLDKLQKLDKEMYGDIPPVPTDGGNQTLPPLAKAKSVKDNKGSKTSKNSEMKTTTLPSAIPPPSSSSHHNRTQQQIPRGKDDKNSLFPNKTTVITPVADPPETVNSAEQQKALQKIISINSNNTKKMMDTLMSLQDPYGENSNKGNNNINVVPVPPKQSSSSHGGSGRPLSATAPQKNNKMAEKMERLVKH